jgi:hypothetical protein
MVLDSYREEYRELSDNWRSLDTKAQGTAAIAGIFLAAALAFVRELAKGLASFDRALLVLAITTLFLVVLLAVFAMKVRQVEMAPNGEDFERMTDDLLSPELLHELPTRLPALVRDRAKVWRQVNAKVAEQNGRKAELLSWSTWGLAISALLIAILIARSVL